MDTTTATENAQEYVLHIKKWNLIMKRISVKPKKFEPVQCTFLNIWMA